MSKTVTINGRVYDVHTGMPIDEPAATPAHKPKPVHPSHSLHQATQKSHTLNRRIVQKTASTSPGRVQSAVRQDITQHPSITKFAPHPSGVMPKTAMAAPQTGPVAHPIVEKARAHHQTVKGRAIAANTPKPSHIIKQEAIEQSLQQAPSHSANHKQVKAKRRFPRALSIASASLALLLLGGYFTYLNMPSLSVRVAAAQAGVDASYPSYHPDGYSLNGPVAYTQGKVMMKFASNSGPQSFNVDQTKTSWDSSAVLENYVKAKAGENYITYDEHGLTIYTFGGNAAWVNGGVLYTISGDAPLSGDQIRHIATSM